MLSNLQSRLLDANMEMTSSTWMDTLDSSACTEVLVGRFSGLACALTQER